MYEDIKRERDETSKSQENWRSGRRSVPSSTTTDNPRGRRFLGSRLQSWGMFFASRSAGMNHSPVDLQRKRERRSRRQRALSPREEETATLAPSCAKGTTSLAFAAGKERIPLPAVAPSNCGRAKAAIQQAFATTNLVVTVVSAECVEADHYSWRVETKAVGGEIPTPSPSNFLKMRLYVTKHLPYQSALSGLYLSSFGNEWEWGLKFVPVKPSRASKAVRRIKAAARKLAPCLQNQPAQRRLAEDLRIQQQKAEVSQKNVVGYFWRKSKPGQQRTISCVGSLKQQVPVLRQPRAPEGVGFKDRRRVSSTTSAADKVCVPMGGNASTAVSDRAHPSPRQAEINHSMKSETEADPAKIYTEFDFRMKLYSFKRPGLEDLVALRLIAKCFGGTSQNYAWAVDRIKSVDPAIRASDIPRLYEELSSRLGISDSFVRGVSSATRGVIGTKGDIPHVLCLHD